VRIITAVRFHGGYLNKTLQQIDDLSDKDMALLTTMTYGVIKKYDYLKALILQEQADIKLKRSIEVILVVAFYQYIFLDKIPQYAIIDTAVELAKEKEDIVAGQFVNAFLHKAFSEGKELVLDKTRFASVEDRLAVIYSVPVWLVKLLFAQYGEEDTRFFLEMSELPAKTFIRINQLKPATFSPEDEYVRTPVPYCFEAKGGNQVKNVAFATGMYTIQNISSQTVGYFVDPQASDRILDMCAAPGGKTTQLAELTADKADITALDIYEERVAQIKKNAQRLGIKSIQAIRADATDFQSKTMYDKILLDAPCSGLGTLAQKPEIRYHVSPEMLDELVVLQQKLIAQAWRLLAEGGELTYSTCTINRKENERQVQAMLKEYPNASLIEERHIFKEMRNGYAGFYLAKIKKQKL